MTETVFVDTNVLVYCWDAVDTAKQARAQLWETSLWESGRGRLSGQVLHEFYVTVTRKLTPGLDKDMARQQVRDYRLWRPVPADGRLVDLAWAMQDRFKFSYWDALIVAAAEISGSKYLLSEDLQHDQQLLGVRVVDPFQVEPSELEQ